MERMDTANDFPEDDNVSVTHEDTDAEEELILQGTAHRSSVVNRTSSLPIKDNWVADDDINADISDGNRVIAQSLFVDESMRWTDLLGELWTQLNKCWRWQYYVAHSKREMFKRKFNYCLGCCSCFVVVIVAALCYTMIAKAPAVFLNEAESDGGQIDMRIRPSESSESSYLNYTQLSINTQVSPDFQYHSPRHALWTRYYSRKCTQTLRDQGITPTSPLESRYENCAPDCSSLCGDSWSQWDLWLINSKREKAMGLGRSWPYGTIPPGQAVISLDLALYANLSRGDTMWVTTSPGHVLRTVLYHQMVNRSFATNSTRDIWAVLDRSMLLPIRVFDVFRSYAGKMPSDFKGSMAIMEYESFLPWLSDNLRPELDNATALQVSTGAHIEVKQLLKQTNLQEFAHEVAVNLPPSRIKPYLSTQYDDIRGVVVGFASRFLFFVGFPDIDADLDILFALFQIRFFTLFLGLILSIILTILFLLSSMLIYSLLQISIETRTFELGVHRMVGMSRLGIVEMLLIQACSYSIPAWVLGLVLAQVFTSILLSGIESSLDVPIDTGLTTNAIMAATVLGLLIPIVAAVVPIRNALENNLFESLDVKHSKTAAVKINIERSEDSGISGAWFVVGAGLAVFGFLIYYLMPLSLLTFNLALFFNIFFGILLGLLFGLILLALNAEHLMEKLVMSLTLWWESKPVRNVTLKNLIAHRVRNRKTTMMYALAIGFVIFISVMFAMELSSAEARILKTDGAKLRIAAADRDNGLTPTQVASLESLARSEKYKDVIQGYTWVSKDVEHARNIEDVFITNLGHIMEAPTHVWAVAPNFYDVAESQFLTRSRGISTSLSLSEQFYTVRGSQSLGVSSGLADSHNIGMDTRFLTVPEPKVGVASSVKLRTYVPIAMMDQSPFFLFTRFQTTRHVDALTSFPSLMRVVEDKVDSLDDLEMYAMLFKLKDGLSDDVVDALVEDIHSAASRGHDYRIKDFRDIKGALDQTKQSMGIIFGVATYIAMGLCLFSLMASMFTNIFEQSKEIAILRAMGMTQSLITRIFVYESFVLVMASSLLGIMIGCVMAWTMMAQRVLFTQLPVEVEFPTTILLLIVIAAFISAIISSYLPAKQLVRQTVAQVMRTVV